MPHYAIDYDMAQLEQKHAARDEIATQVQLRVSGESLEKIFNGAKEDDQSVNEGVKITLNDALVAYLVKVLNQCQGEPTRMVTLVLNYLARVPTLPRLQPSTHPQHKETPS
ncbi:hypothetical protein FS837_008534 [Tulasnella sp. UAMH 9824]|nr:hypothetical protein FS837_008534 [Tulasnella sp. UAMH 9824]